MDKDENITNDNMDNTHETKDEAKDETKPEIQTENIKDKDNTEQTPDNMDQKHDIIQMNQN